jgi:hypothetical protein
MVSMLRVFLLHQRTATVSRTRDQPQEATQIAPFTDKFKSLLQSTFMRLAFDTAALRIAHFGLRISNFSFTGAPS